MTTLPVFAVQVAGWPLCLCATWLWLRERFYRQQGRMPAHARFILRNSGHPAHHCALPELRQQEPGRWWIGYAYVGPDAVGHCSECGKTYRVEATDAGASWHEVES